MRNTTSSTELSIVVPAYNEAQVIETSIERIASALQALDQSFEIIVVDDGSTDATWRVLQKIAARNSFLVTIKLSRNFGQQAALTAGLSQSTGDVIAIIDADLQDPPEEIPAMIAKLKSGYDVVYGKRTSRPGESLFKKFTAAVYYRTIAAISDVALPIDSGDFRVLRRTVLDAYLSCPERSKYARGLFSWVGFRQTHHEYNRDERIAGETKYTFKKMVLFALDGITSFSTKPLRLAFYFSLVCVSVAGFLAAWVIFSWLSRHTVAGWSSLAAIILLLGAAQLLVLGIIGEYIATIIKETKERPLYLVEQVGNRANGADDLGPDPQGFTDGRILKEATSSPK